MKKSMMLSSTLCNTFLLLGASDAFVVRPSMPNSSSHMTIGPGGSPAMGGLSMLPNCNFDLFCSDFDLDLNFGSEFTSQLSSVGEQLFPWMQKKVEDPTVEAGVLSGMAHMTLDFSGMLFNPSKEMLRLFSVVGRLSVIFADYLPDHSINPTELIIQLFFLFLAVKDLTKFDSMETSRSIA